MQKESTLRNENHGQSHKVQNKAYIISIATTFGGIFLLCKTIEFPAARKLYKTQLCHSGESLRRLYSQLSISWSFFIAPTYKGGLLSFLHNFCSLNVALKLVSIERRPVLHYQHQTFRHLPFQRRLVSEVNIPCFLWLQRNDKPPTHYFFCAFKQS